MKKIDFMEVGGFQVGHAQDIEAATGCTVILFDHASPAGAEIRGGGPASRETPLLLPTSDASGLHAILLSGGSAFGLDAAGGVMRYLEERNIGLDVGVTKVPLVCQSCVFDLAVGKADVRPDPAMGYEACQNASGQPMEEGNIGAGTGCTVGKIMGPAHAIKSGIGCYAVQVGEVKVGAIAAVNALGDVYDIDTGAPLAGIQMNGAFCSSEQVLRESAAHTLPSRENTTLGVIITNAKFDKSLLTKIAAMTHNGYARAIRPVHTTADGDTIYAVSTGDVACDVNVAGAIASYVMGKAINRAVLTAKSAYGYPAVDSLGNCKK